MPASALKGMQPHSQHPHHKPHPRRHNANSSGNSSSCGGSSKSPTDGACGCSGTSPTAAAADLDPSTETATAAAGTAAGNEETDDNEEEEEQLPAVCCSFFDITDAAVRAAIEKELKFIPEYTNYYRCNTQPLHRGQVGKTSRKYDNDYAIYDYRKFDFGMAKLSSLNLAGMHDAGVLIVTDWEEEEEEGEQQQRQQQQQQHKQTAAAGPATWAASAGGAAQNQETAPHHPAATAARTAASKVAMTGKATHSFKRKPVVLQVIHVSTTDEIDRIGTSSSSSNSCNSSSGPATPIVNPRFVIHVGRNAKCRVHQTHVSLSSLLSPAEQQQLQQIKQQQQKESKGFRGPLVNSATRIVVEEGGEVHHVYSQELNEETAHIENISVCCQDNSKYRLTHVDLGAAFSRFALQVEGAEGSTHISRGLSVLHGKQRHAKFEMFHHLQPDAVTDQVHRSLVAGNGRAVWRGRIRIERDGIGADASSLNRVILLEDGATCVAVPTLEIIPEDIKKATHGAAIRDFDTEPLFYMRSRGIPTDKAKRLLMLAFADDVVKPTEDPRLAARVQEKVEQLLPKGGAAAEDLQRHHMFRGGDGGT
ncbi:sufB/sufD domain-containing protein, putative [Eimeria maxima]|uniref:SufB/sufD domain-containing protein, putative n=1 Tax=Eimeria maxima TaxID=5804 RepID=U6LZJ0_EIMMA|nr:sufB/sufD domain-containing protein, putative [Eimeria maxima]CDJ57387.1 sufB/sufD domain-containing protein, putative [Eimeria maxima]